MCIGLLGSTAIEVSFCGVMQPRFDAPLLLTASQLMASMSLVAAYAAVVLKGAERQRATAASGASKSSSSPSCAHGALMVGSNFQLFSGVAALGPGMATRIPATSADAPASIRMRLAMRSPR